MSPHVALAVLAAVLAWPVPRLLARLTGIRRSPRAALVLWQASAVAAVLAALFAAPAAAIAVAGPSRSGPAWAVALAAVVTAVVAGRLLLSGDRVGRRLRTARRRHRELVDLLASDADARMRVLEHATPTAYCVPGLQRRVVVTQGTLDSLSPAELDAVLAHERAHLRARHDLVLEFFTVMHEAVPTFVRSGEALHSVTLLIEVLADRSAVRTVGVVSTARAIVAMVGGPRPDGALAMADTASDARLRLDLLESGPVLGLPAPVAGAVLYAVSLALVAGPVVLLALAWAGAATS